MGAISTVYCVNVDVNKATSILWECCIYCYAVSVIADHLSIIRSTLFGVQLFIQYAAPTITKVFEYLLHFLGVHSLGCIISNLAEFVYPQYTL